MTRRRLIIAISLLVVLIAGIAISRASRKTPLTSSVDDIPVAYVKRGELDLRVYTTGELQAKNSVTLSAPPVAGASLQITHLLHTGAVVKKGDVVIEFDPTEQHYVLEQSRSELQQAEQDILKAKSDAAVQKAQDDVALLKARFDVRQAELEVQKNELVSSIDAQKNKLALDQAKRALAELEQDIKSHGTTGQTGIDLAQEKWNKAKLSMDVAQQNIDKMHVIATTDGLVSIEKNMTGDFLFSGMALPDFHEGDQVQPGTGIARVIVSSEMQLSAKVSELERANITIGQPAEIEFDALPGRTFHGTVKSAGGMVQRPFWETASNSKFDISIQLSDGGSALRPGLTAQIVILGAKNASTLYVPRLAIFQKDGKQTVYLKKASGFEQLQVKVGAQNESRTAVEGLHEGDQVALIDPTAPRKSSSSGSSSPVGGGNL
ncbi:MAG TPA: HlyD family efflux transporter periplasmic adaptor subunit [Terriglobales bacterium]|nr:HlyD family efflux transporter periplasmic adaptor subunit [Terriglobales bacterium]